MLEVKNVRQYLMTGVVVVIGGVLIALAWSRGRERGECD